MRSSVRRARSSFRAMAHRAALPCTEATTSTYLEGIDMHATQDTTWDLADNGNGRTLDELATAVAFALISNMLFVCDAS